MFEYGTKSDAERVQRGFAVYRRGCAVLLFLAGICLIAFGHGTAWGVFLLAWGIEMSIVEVLSARRAAAKKA
jgi:hypothetical protein